MASSNLVSSYRNGLHTVRVYADRVALGIFSEKSYQIEEIQSMEIKKAIFGNGYVNLVLNDGSKTDSNVMIDHKDALACQREIAILVCARPKPTDVIFRCTVLGGTGISIENAAACLAIFGRDAVSVMSGDQLVDISLDELTSLKLNGPGRVTTDAGVAGGGFGIEGAAIGIGMAALINTLTTKSTTNTILYLSWVGGEMFLHTSSHTPEDARLLLSSAFTAVQAAKPAPFANNAPPSSIVDVPAMPVSPDIASKAADVSGNDLLSQLERLAALMTTGHLTAEEFSLAKSSLLGRQPI